VRSSPQAKAGAKEAGAQVRAYFTCQPPRARVHLRQLRAAIRAAAPGVVDAFSYGIPAFRFNGQLLVGYAGWKNHCSIYPVTAAVRLAAQQKGFETAKGTLRLPLDRPVPVLLVKRLVRERLRSVRRRSER
jgi:uncharacterized protein YdhG (YjbR/CyaY superfamily)